MENRLCSRCGVSPSRSYHPYCSGCLVEYQRRWRRESERGRASLVRDNARRYAAVYLARGRLVAQPCEGCGSAAVGMYHDDPAKPLEVRWRCRACQRRRAVDDEI